MKIHKIKIIAILILTLGSLISHAQKRNRKYDKVIIINDDNSSKQEIVNVYQEIINYTPKIVALNFNFIYKGKQDSILNDFFKINAEKVIIPSHKLSENEEYVIKQSKGFNYLGEESIGNYYAFDKDTIYKEFYPFSKVRRDSLKTTKEETFLAFAIAITMSYDDMQTEQFLKKNINKIPIKIKYSITEKDLYVFNKKDILSGNYPKDIFKDKIVLIGYLDSKGSTLFKTGNKKHPKMHGVIIDANIIKQILEEK